MITAAEVRPGDRINVRGLELTVTRIDAAFLGIPTMVCFVESTDERWQCVPTATDAEVDLLT